jgi:chorismate-pyruvate lyase
MSEPGQSGPDLRELFSVFRPFVEVPLYEVISADEMPEPYRGLLVHEQHMTVTVEAFHGDLVDVHILDRWQSGDLYSRNILLRLQKTGRVVQFGIVRVDLSYLAPEVCAEIIAGKTPFGRILINHNVFRRIEPTTFLRLRPGPKLMAWFGMTVPGPVYGRLAYIHCDEKPAVELLEVVAP